MSEPRGVLLAEFDDPARLLAATRQLVVAGYHVDAYGPVYVEGLAQALGEPAPRRISCWSFAVGLLGGFGMFAFQVWAMVVDWPIDVGGRATLSWPAFIVPAFECTILAAALAAVIALIGYADLVRPHHPVFDFEAFERASDARFFLAVECEHPRLPRAQARALLERLAPLEVHELEG